LKLEKIIYILWSPDSMDKERTRDLLLNEVADKLLKAGSELLTIYIADPEAEMKSPAPKLYPGKLLSAMISSHVKSMAAARKIEALLSKYGFEFSGYRADESIYTEYGGNRHCEPRNWCDCERSPGITMVTLMERPKKFTHEQWVKKWHTTISPVSEELQPRTRYVRNEILEPITPGAPEFEGIVAECWPSKKHVSNSFLFYGAGNVFQLVVNMFRILKAVTSFTSLRRIQVNVMSEYIIKSAKPVKSVGKK
jgi:hypothetical protein